MLNRLTMTVLREREKTDITAVTAVMLRITFSFWFLSNYLHLCHAIDGVSSLQSSSQLWWGIHTPLFPRFQDTLENITALRGESAFLPCSVEHIGDRSVTWMRCRDLHILTAGVFTYSADDRFRVIHPENTNDWTLEITFTTDRDSGEYECQVNSDPKISRKVHLKVKENNQLDDPGSFKEKSLKQFPVFESSEISKETEFIIEKNPRRKKHKRRRQKYNRNKISPEPMVYIEGAMERHIQMGSVLSLTCIVTHHPRMAPKQLHWFHEDEQLNYDSIRGGVSVQTEKLLKKTVSKLSVSYITANDSGRYSCNPSNHRPFSVIVHAQNGQHHAAVQQEGVSLSCPDRNISICLLFFLATIYCFLK